MSLNNFHRNFETNEEKQTVKVKPIQAMKNTCKVELFDALTGKKREEVVSENLINNNINTLMAKHMFIQEVFTTYGGLATGQIFLPRSYFGAIYLSDSTDAEDADLKTYVGNTIGWADRNNTYVGADTKRGTVNLNESMRTAYDTVRLVFDWGTSAANGTFQTVNWMSSHHVASGTAWAVPTPVNTHSVSSGVLGVTMATVAPCAINGSKIYSTTSSDGKIYSTIMTGQNTFVRDSTTVTQEADLGASDNDVTGIRWDGTNYWVFGDQTDKMYKLDTSFNIVTSWSITAASYLSTNRQFCCFGGNIYTAKYIDTNTLNVFKFDTSGSLLATYNVMTSGRTYHTSAAKNDTFTMVNDDNNLYIFSSATSPAQSGCICVIEFDGNGNVLADYGMFNTTAISQNCVWNPYFKMFETGTSTSYVFNMLKAPTTQTLLTVPITKTASNTMKISYELSVDFSLW